MFFLGATVGALLCAALVPDELLWPSLVVYFAAAATLLFWWRGKRLAPLASKLANALDEHQQRFGKRAVVRGAVSEFGGGFAEGYAEEAANQGDLHGILIAAAVALGSKVVSDLTKTQAERASEASISKIAAELRAVRSRAPLATVGLVVACVASGQLRRGDMLPSLLSKPTPQPQMGNEAPVPAASPSPTPAAAVPPKPPVRKAKKYARRTAPDAKTSTGSAASDVGGLLDPYSGGDDGTPAQAEGVIPGER